MKKILLTSLTLISALGLFSCGQKEENKEPDNPNKPIDPPIDDPNKPTDPPIVEEKDTLLDLTSPGKNKSYQKLETFEPTLFKKDSFKKENETKLIEGANHLTYTFSLNNGHKVDANVVEVDLTKAKLDTNYSKTGVATPYSQLKDYEATENKKVAAIINADFFFTGQGPSINAYVKNNEVIKDSHNDNGGYDYTDPKNDIPASKPMLLGISGSTAKIAPSLGDASIKDTIQAKFTNELVFVDKDKKEKVYNQKISLNETSFGESNEFIVITKELSVVVLEGAKIYTVEKEASNTFIKGTIKSALTQKLEGKKSFKDTDKKFYVISKNDLSYKSGDKIGISITSKDESWAHYNHIIGGRQSLVENGEIAKTVTLENSNGAQSTNIPRSAVGVKDENTLVMVAIESLRYNKKNEVKPKDSYGVNLPELAEFMRYLGCYDAMNFDGGGSTNLITQKENEAPKVVVRSSDYGTYELNASRKVYNTLLVTTL